MAKKSLLAIDISDHSIEVLVLAKPIFGRPKVMASGRALLRGKVIEAGIIKIPEKLAAELAAVLAAAAPKPIKNPHCILSLPNSVVFTTMFYLPAGLKKQEIKNTVAFKGEEVIPFKSAEIYFDFKTIEAAGDTQAVFYVAVSADIVDSYIDVLHRAGLRPMAFDLESISASRALFDLKKNYRHAKLVMDIGARTTDLNIFDQNGIRQSETVKIAGDRFTRAIMANLKVTAKTANDLKAEHGLNPAGRSDKVLFILQNEVKKIIIETKKFISLYQSQSQRKIDGIIVIGGSALLPNLEQYLADNLGLEINLGNPLEKIDDPDNILEANDGSIMFTNVIGSALRGLSKDPVFGDINLLPAAPRKFSIIPRRDQIKAWKKIYISLGILIVLSLVLGGVIYGQSQGSDIFRRFLSVSVPEENFNPPAKIIENLPAIMPPAAISTSSPATSTPSSALPVSAIKTPTSTPKIAAPIIKVKIKPTSLGYLNVRGGAGLNFAKVGQVNPDEIYTVIKEQNGWYQINFGAKKTGWILSSYADEIK